MNHAFLILTHKPIDNFFYYAKLNKDIYFYVHVDKKNDISKIKKETHEDNIFFLDDEYRIDIKWAGFSMIQATINLISYALKHYEGNEYFHLISGDDVVLKKNISWKNSDIFIECRESREHQYRMRFNTPHADTKYQRTLLGKAFTQFYKKIDKILPTQEKFYFGSQWFSIRRNELEILMNSITENDIKFFKKKLCPDEHFFQYLIAKNQMLSKVSVYGNKRFIEFDPKFQRGSSPLFLNTDKLSAVQKQNYWFARKVEPQEMQKFYTNLN